MAARRTTKVLPTTMHEAMLWQEGYQYIAGIDEVGRGPLAGPVVTAAVILDPERIPEGLDDSKRLSEKKRNLLATEIMQTAWEARVVAVSADAIDEMNILQATKYGMTEAVHRMMLKPDALLLDAITLPALSQMKQVDLIKGDQQSVSIAAASIVAKVIRDGIMVHMDERYPGYGFARHKGYGTKRHYEGLDAYGPCPIHRRSFLKKWEVLRA